MPFGMTNAPATFQRVMELALRGLQWTICLIYLDDVIIFSSSLEQHIERLTEVLERIKKANLKLKPDKCELFQVEVPFLGHVVSKDGIKPNPHNIAKVKQWKEPENVTEVRQFLGLCSYYRRHIRNFSLIAKPLADLTRKESPLVWTPECQKAFEELKEKLIGPEIMAYPHDAGNFIIDTDASDFGIGAVLSQIQNEVPKVIAYASRSLNKSERNYCVTDKELLALKYFIEYFKHYLLGRQFLARTDHQALIWLFSLREPKGRIARWIEILSAYQFSIEYRPGKRHGNADAMSRCPNPRDCHCGNEDSTEMLRCGPCTKCQKRTTDMQSTLQSAIRQARAYNEDHTPSVITRICKTSRYLLQQCCNFLLILFGIFQLHKNLSSEEQAQDGKQQPQKSQKLPGMFSLDRGSHTSHTARRTRPDTKNEEIGYWTLDYNLRELINFKMKTLQ